RVAGARAPLGANVVVLATPERPSALVALSGCDQRARLLTGRVPGPASDEPAESRAHTAAVQRDLRTIQRLGARQGPGSSRARTGGYHQASRQPEHYGRCGTAVGRRNTGRP